jgi:hypothetical protein
MFLPKTFRRGGYDVAVNADRSIKVRPGLYSLAIYGDFGRVDKFKRKNGARARLGCRVRQAFDSRSPQHRIEIYEKSLLGLNTFSSTLRAAH